MKGISRRARACAVVAVTGATVLAGAASPMPSARRTSATVCRPARARPDVQLRRLHQQRRRRHRWLDRRHEDGCSTRHQHRQRGRWHGCATPTSPACRTTASTRCSPSCRPRASTTSSCSVTPASRPTPTSPGLTALPRAARQEQPARRRLARHITEAEWPARVTAAKILGCDSIGSGGFPTRASARYDNTLRTVETAQPPRQVLGRGRRRPRLHPQPPGEFDAATWTTASARRRGRSSWSASTRVTVRRDRRRLGLGRVRRRDRHRVAGLINQFPTNVKMLHIKDGANVAAPAAGPSDSRAPVRLAAPSAPA